MAPTSTSVLVDRIIPGGLKPFLETARGNDETFADITYRLRAEHDIRVTEETVRRWCALILDAEATA
jgi:hypothetical protein